MHTNTHTHTHTHTYTQTQTHTHTHAHTHTHTHTHTRTHTHTHTHTHTYNPLLLTHNPTHSIPPLNTLPPIFAVRSELMLCSLAPIKATKAAADRMSTFISQQQDVGLPLHRTTRNCWPFQLKHTDTCVCIGSEDMDSLTHMFFFLFFHYYFLTYLKCSER